MGTSGSYELNCQECGHRYYTVSSGQWNIPGTITIYPSYGYCTECCGEGFKSWWWEGNVVKAECRACSNLIGVVSWYDWRHRSGERVGFCNGCYNRYQAKKRAQEARERREREERERKEKHEREDEARRKKQKQEETERINKHDQEDKEIKDNHKKEDKERKDKHKKEDKERTDKHKKEDKERKDKHKKEDKERKDKHRKEDKEREDKHDQEDKQRKQKHDREDNERKDKHDQEDQQRKQKHDREDNERKEQRDKEDKARKEQNRIQQEERAKKREKIAKQKQEAKKAASRVEKELDDLLGDSSESKQNDDEVDIKDIPSLIKDIDAGIAAAEKELQAANDLKDEIDAAAASKDVDDLLSGMENSPTIAMESEYEEIMKKIRTQRNSLSAKKQKLREREKKAAEQSVKFLDEQNKINDQMKKAMETKMDLDEKRKKLETCKLDMATFGIAADNVGEEELNKLNSKFEAAYSELLTKYAGNESQIKALNDCQERMKKIKAKIMADSSQCKYLIELLDAECTRLSEASDEAMAKFEQRSKYFLCVTCGLPQDTVSKFIDDEGYELEDILELTEQDLKDLGLKKGGVRKKVMRQIQALKQSST